MQEFEPLSYEELGEQIQLDAKIIRPEHIGLFVDEKHGELNIGDICLMESGEYRKIRHLERWMPPSETSKNTADRDWSRVLPLVVHCHCDEWGETGWATFQGKELVPDENQTTGYQAKRKMIYKQIRTKPRFRYFDPREINANNYNGMPGCIPSNFDKFMAKVKKVYSHGIKRKLVVDEPSDLDLSVPDSPKPEEPMPTTPQGHIESEPENAPPVIAITELGLSEEIEAKLTKAGLGTVEELREYGIENLTAIKGIGGATQETVITAYNAYLDQQDATPAEDE